MSFDVFISYAHQDKLTADAACAIVEKAGIRCWIAPRDLPPGAEYASALMEALENCRALVLIFSGRANESPHIRREVERAVSRGIPLIPVRIEDIEPHAALKYFVGSVHWLDALTPPLEQHFERLARTLRSILDGEAASADTRAGPVRRVETVPADELRDRARARILHRAQWSAFACLSLGGVLIALAVTNKEMPELLLSMGGAVSYYGLVYRNIPSDLETAKNISFIQTGVVLYFSALALMAARWTYFAVELIDAIVAIYSICQLIALQRLQRGDASPPKK